MFSVLATQDFRRLIPGVEVLLASGEIASDYKLTADQLGPYCPTICVEDAYRRAVLPYLVVNTVGRLQRIRILIDPGRRPAGEPLIPILFIWEPPNRGGLMASLSLLALVDWEGQVPKEICDLPNLILQIQIAT